MMRKLTILIIFAFNLSLLSAQIDKSDNSNLSNLISDFETVSLNHITSTMSNNGTFIDGSRSNPGGQGMQIKKSAVGTGSGVGTTYSSSFWVSSETDEGALIGVIGDWSEDMRAGVYGGDINDPSRIYLVNVDMLDNPENYTDFQNWPVDQGAPWVDVDGDGVYSPLPNGADHPKFYGDQVAFFVSADDDKAYKSNMGTDPTHLEFQFIVYSFYRPDVAPSFNNTVF